MSISDLQVETVVLEAFKKALEFGFVVFCYALGRSYGKEVKNVGVLDLLRLTFFAIVVAVIIPFGVFYLNESIFTKSVPALSVISLIAVVFGFFNKRGVAE